MVRGRSPSPDRRERRRSRSRDRERRHRPERPLERERPARRSRSRSPGGRRRSRSPVPRRRSRSPVQRRRSRSISSEKDSSSKDVLITAHYKPPITDADMKNLEPEDNDMMRMMGFSGFDSTKGKKVEGNDVYEANIIHKRKFRQYMNRRGGFNRPLDFIA